MNISNSFITLVELKSLKAFHMDYLRYWSHVVNCRSCSAAHKGLNALEVALQIVATILVGIVAATKQTMISAFLRSTLVIMAVLCFAASKLLSHFIYKNFHFHDYNHALR